MSASGQLIGLSIVTVIGWIGISAFGAGRVDAAEAQVASFEKWKKQDSDAEVRKAIFTGVLRQKECLAKAEVLSTKATCPGFPLLALPLGKKTLNVKSISPSAVIDDNAKTVWCGYTKETSLQMSFTRVARLESILITVERRGPAGVFVPLPSELVVEWGAASATVTFGGSPTGATSATSKVEQLDVDSEGIIIRPSPTAAPNVVFCISDVRINASASKLQAIPDEGTLALGIGANNG